MVLVKTLNFLHLFFFLRKIGQEILERKKKVLRLQKIWKLFNFLCKIGQENVFDNILGRKKAFLDSKITKISQQNLFDVILESQKTFLDYKKKKLKKVEKSGFFQRG